MLACETENLKGALMLAAYGADMRHVEKVRLDSHGIALVSIVYADRKSPWSCRFSEE